MAVFVTSIVNEPSLILQSLQAIVDLPSVSGAVHTMLALSRLGLHGEIGLVVAGSRRASFPEQSERLLLGVATNQGAMGLQEARLLSEQKRLSSELDRRVAERTRDLARANEKLRAEISERRRVEEQLRRSEAFLAQGQNLSSVGNFS